FGARACAPGTCRSCWRAPRRCDPRLIAGSALQTSAAGQFDLKPQTQGGRLPAWDNHALMTPEQYVQNKAAASGSSFYYAFLFLPRERREAITAFYAFCREVDDVVDEV